MPLPRSEIVSLDATSVYHVVSRCVRRHFLCGVDSLSGKDFSHRREWIRKRIFELAEIFAIDVCSYAVMSNHCHLVVCIQKDQALSWSDREVAERWCRLFGGDSRVRSFAEGSVVPETHRAFVTSRIKVYRERLYNLSWFMRCLNEPIARMANAEDKVTGRFWEGRFKSQALLDEGAVLAVMAYVDLNPIRAAMAKTPEESDYTSVQQRIVEQAPTVASGDTEAIKALPEDLQAAIGKLMPFADQIDPSTAEFDAHRAIAHLPCILNDYLELVDWSGRAIAHGKRGAINADLPPILERLKLRPEAYLKYIRRDQETRFGHFIGAVESMKNLAQQFGKRFLKGQTAAAALFSPG
jgi:REP element-mobilizing transposase RayT